MDRLKLIQTLINQRQFKTYLEIGVLGGSNFFEVECFRKIAVDPQFKFNWKGRLGATLRNITNARARFFETTSDNFFATFAPEVFKEKQLHIALVDGMHEFDYALRDVLNCLQYLSNNGVIVLHDCNPVTEEAACSFDEWKKRGFSGFWNGDVWKSIVYLNKNRPDLNVCVVDADHGLGIITRSTSKKRSSELIPIAEIRRLTYQDLEKDRSGLLNLCDVSALEAFLEK